MKEEKEERRGIGVGGREGGGWKEEGKRRDGKRKEGEWRGGMRRAEDVQRKEKDEEKEG